MASRRVFSLLSLESPCLLRFSPLVVALRPLSASSRLHARTTTPSQLREIGEVLPRSDLQYESGQLFVHRLFAYKGIILCAFNAKLNERRERSSEVITSNELQYQVLVHRGDWAHMGFPVDLTAYLAEGGSAGRGEKLMTTMNGVDCVSHSDVVPFAGSERAPIDHDLFDRLFQPLEENGAVLPAVRYAIRQDIRSFTLASAQSWMAPIHVCRETTEGVEVTVTTFYLGPNIVSGQQKHTWRYVIRLVNLASHAVTIRERQLKVFSLNNMHQHNGHGVVGRQPQLTPSRPAFQFSSTVELAQSKGGHMWGAFKMERENGSLFEVTIPMFILEAPGSEPSLPVHPLSPSPSPPSIETPPSP